MLRLSLVLLALCSVYGRYSVDPEETNVTPALTPAPVTSAPVTSAPVVPTTVSPAPVTSEPASSAPVTAAPVHSPTDAPVAPTPQKCELNADGFYGDSSSVSEIVTYTYEMETVANPVATPEENIQNLETAVLDSLLPTLFAGDGCTRRILRSRRRLTAVGASILPDDVILPGLSCTIALESAANQCVKVEGKLTLFSDGNSNTAALDALEGIIANMNSGSYNNATPDIVKVTYVDVIPDPVEQNPIDNTPEDGEDGGNGLNASVYVVIAAGALLVIAAAVFYGRRQLRGRDTDLDTSIQSTNPSSVNYNSGVQS